MGTLDGRVAIVTGAGRGIGREHALFLASEGASVVVNDVGRSLDGEEATETTAEQVVAEIVASGGHAAANSSDVSDWDQGGELIDQAVDTFGRLDILVNNAGIVRDAVLINMTEAEWDSVLAVNLKGHFVPTRWAANYWRSESKAGREVAARLVHTSSGSGLSGNPGQANYGAAKAGVAALSLICAKELSRYGVHSNCLVPTARTRMTEATPWLSERIKAPSDSAAPDPWDPANMSPIVGYLAMADCPFNGCTFSVRGGNIRLMNTWGVGDGVKKADGRWTVPELVDQLGPLASDRQVAKQ
jgi:NAD(P)-dependent dehydrogenase (short-subunit alcohol dehydrogenase family)